MATQVWQGLGESGWGRACMMTRHTDREGRTKGGGWKSTDLLPIVAAQQAHQMPRMPPPPLPQSQDKVINIRCARPTRAPGAEPYKAVPFFVKDLWRRTRSRLCLRETRDKQTRTFGRKDLNTTEDNHVFCPNVIPPLFPSLSLPCRDTNDACSHRQCAPRVVCNAEERKETDQQRMTLSRNELFDAGVNRHSWFGLCTTTRFLSLSRGIMELDNFMAL